MTKFEIPIEWKMSIPPIIAQRSFHWPPISHLPLDQSSETEEILGWPKGTVTILNHAFQNKLGRNVHWTPPRDEDPAPFMHAAEVYKRGVGCGSDKRAHYSGEYTITVYDYLDTVFQNARHDTTTTFCDENVLNAWPNLTKAHQVHPVKINESRKNLDTIAKIVSTIRAEKTSSVTIIGGGVLADTAAFAAHICKVDFHLIPTTLLSMVDACVGGKTGVNHPPFGKNQVGAFSFPSSVTVFKEFLETLPQRHYDSGRSECFKHSFLAGNKNLVNSLLLASEAKRLSTEVLAEVIKIKGKVVAQDPTETGVRATLNLGHTLAHALEAFSHQNRPTEEQIQHGEAVNVGLLFQTFLSDEIIGKQDCNNFQRMVLRKADLIKPLNTIQKQTGLDFSTESAQILEKIRHDKKDTGNEGYTNWIILKDLGSPYIHADSYLTPVADKDFLKAWSLMTRYLKNI